MPERLTHRSTIFSLILVVLAMAMRPVEGSWSRFSRAKRLQPVKASKSGRLRETEDRRARDACKFALGHLLARHADSVPTAEDGDGSIDAATLRVGGFYFSPQTGFIHIEAIDDNQLKYRSAADPTVLVQSEKDSFVAGKEWVNLTDRRRLDFEPDEVARLALALLVRYLPTRLDESVMHRLFESAKKEEATSLLAFVATVYQTTGENLIQSAALDNLRQVNTQAFPLFLRNSHPPKTHRKEAGGFATRMGRHFKDHAVDQLILNEVVPRFDESLAALRFPLSWLLSDAELQVSSENHFTVGRYIPVGTIGHDDDGLTQLILDTERGEENSSTLFDRLQEDWGSAITGFWSRLVEAKQQGTYDDIFVVPMPTSNGRAFLPFAARSWARIHRLQYAEALTFGNPPEARQSQAVWWERLDRAAARDFRWAQPAKMLPGKKYAVVLVDDVGATGLTAAKATMAILSGASKQRPDLSVMTFVLGRSEFASEPTERPAILTQIDSTAWTELKGAMEQPEVEREPQQPAEAADRPSPRRRGPPRIRFVDREGFLDSDQGKQLTRHFIDMLSRADSASPKPLECAYLALLYAHDVETALTFTSPEALLNDILKKQFPVVDLESAAAGNGAQASLTPDSDEMRHGFSLIRKIVKMFDGYVLGVTPGNPQLTQLLATNYLTMYRAVYSESPTTVGSSLVWTAESQRRAELLIVLKSLFPADFHLSLQLWFEQNVKSLQD